jgi:hypothetical protein
MFAYPPQTAFGKPVPKSRIYLHAVPSRRVKELFVSQLSEIVWAHKLSPDTLHLPARPGVPEIQIFDLHLKTGVLDDEVLHAIDRAVPYPVFHRIRSEKGIAISAAFKRPSEADSSQWVVGARFTSSFIPHNSSFLPLPASIDLGHLYAALFAPLLPLPPRPGESLSAHVTRCETYLRLRRQIDLLTARLHREKQFNRKVEFNQQLKPLLAEAVLLTST